MALNRDDAALTRVQEGLAPYLVRALERAGAEAARLFSEEVTLEHLLGALLADEETALHQLVTANECDAPGAASRIAQLRQRLPDLGTDQ